MNKHILVLDTSSLINHPNIFLLLEDKSFILPIEVLEELDNAKTKNDSSGFNARKANRMIDEIRGGRSLTDGVSFGKGNTLKVSLESDLSLVPAIFSQNVDSKIISVAKKYSQENLYVKVVSADISLRLKANSIGIDSVSDDDLLFGKEDLLYSGCKVINTEPENITDFYRDGYVTHTRVDLYPNQAVILKSGDSSSAIGVVKGSRIVKLRADKKDASVMGMSPKNKEQRFAMEYLLDQDIPMVSIAGVAGTGKTMIAAVSAMHMLDKGVYEKLVICRPAVSVSAGIGFLPGPQPLDAKILTPTGWSTMGALVVGSKVISRDGSQSAVLETFPKGKKKIYRITTTDDTHTECCEDHLWQTKTWEEKKRNKTGSVRSTSEIMRTLNTKSGKLNHYLPRNMPTQFDKIDLPLAPYTLGALLGDGSISGQITLYNTDKDIVERIRMELEAHGCKLHHDGGIGYHIVSNPTHNKTARPVMITNVLTGNHNKYESVGEAFNYIKNISKISKSGFQARCKKESTFDGFICKYLPLENRWQNKIKEILYNIGLENMHSYDKFIPDCYKFSSIEDRANLLRGLMDTDGTIKKNGEASFCTTSKRLAEDVTDIVRSLGGRAVIRQRDRWNENPAVISGRKINKNLIAYEFNISLPEEINPFYAKRKALRHRCSYIYDARIKSIEFIGEKEAKCILIDNPEHLYITDDFIVTHNTKLEKLQPWIQPIFDNLKHMMKCSDMYLNLLIEKGKIEVESLSYIRGRTFPNTIMIIDEAQNSTPSEMKAVITRMGEKSKLIITGDLEQIDSPKLDIYSSGLSTVVNKFKQSELSAHITLTKTERSELAALAAKLL